MWGYYSQPGGNEAGSSYGGANGDDNKLTNVSCT